MSFTIGSRRYLTNFEPHRLVHLFTDTLVIGSGVGGLLAALDAAEEGGEVLVVTKGAANESATAHAQGGIAAAMGLDDSSAAHAEDTLRVGCGLGDETIVRQVVSEAADCIRGLREWGAHFDGSRGELDFGREGGHSASRIVHAHGDATGQEVVRVLLERVRQHPRIRVFEHCFSIDLVTHEGQVRGTVAYHPKYGHQMYWATTTILATGGIGRLFRETTNPAVATGDGLAMAFRAGAVVRDLEMVQFHPTTLYLAGASRALISEAVRGEGAYLLNRAGQRFMPRYDERAELAPRDVVSRAIAAEMKHEEASWMHLDVRHFPAGHFAARFPTIAKLLADFDINPERDLIPIRPSAHYLVGGVLIDAESQTSLPGLLACGEVTCSGLHGANRLASNSLLEGLVFGRRAGRLAAQRARRNGRIKQPPAVSHLLPQSPRTQLDIADVANSLRSVMSRNVGVERSADRLRETIEIVEFWARYIMDKLFDEPAAWETQNMLTIALGIATAAVTRTESRGVHFRTDFPQTDPAWQRHIDLTRYEGGIQIGTREV